MKLRPIYIALALLLAVPSIAAQTSTSNATVASVQVPRLIRFSGTLTTPSTASAASSVVNVTFSLYQEETGGTSLWQETQNVEVDATGHYTVLLGTTHAEGLPIDLFTSGQAQWLGVRPEGQAEQPRIMLVSVPFALKAGDAETLGGKPPSAYVAAPVQGNASAVATPRAASATAGSSGSQGSKSASARASVGTPNYIPVWTSSTNLGSSVMYQSGGFLGIGTTTPVAPLSVINSNANNPAAIVGSSSGPQASGVVGGSTSTTGTPIGVQGTVSAAKGVAVEGENTSKSDTAVAVLGISSGVGVSGDGQAFGVLGSASSSSGTGVYGVEDSETGSTVGVYGASTSTSGSGVSGVASATSGQTTGVDGTSESTSGTGVSGFASATSGQTTGVEGTSESTSGIGVSGTATATTGLTNGVYGATASSSGFGVYGAATAATGATNGVAGETDSTGDKASGVFGAATATTGNTNGVYGTTASSSGSGVYGVATATTGTTIGVVGETNSTGNSASGVAGAATATTGNTYGVYGTTASSSGYGVYGLNSDTTGTGSGGQGVYGETTSPNASAVYGNSTATTGSGFGVYGFSSTGPGVYGQSSGGSGLHGYSSNAGGDGVYALGGASSGDTNGIFADTNSGGGVGAFIDNAAGGYILVGTVYNDGEHQFDVDGSGDGYYGGDLNVSGNLSKGTGSFKIDHPLDPANKYLYHSFVESPDMMNIYNGNITTDGEGLATVQLPEWFEALNRDFRYQLTVMGQFAQAIVADEVANHKFRIKTDKPNVKVSWQVTGIRQDALANAHRIQVEVEKAPEDRGHYLHPELFGAPKEARIIRRSAPHKVPAIHPEPVKAARPQLPQPIIPPARPLPVRPKITPPRLPAAQISRLRVNQK